MSDHEYLIDQILPRHETSLLAGPSGAGKTRFLLPAMVKSWEKGLPVLGFKSHPVPWVYVASDRSEESVKRTLETMSIDPESFPIIPAWDKAMTIPQILDEVDRLKARFAIIESFGSFCEGRHPTAVKHFLQSYDRMARTIDLTTLGMMEAPKQTPSERYENPRQRVSGFASWAHFTETIMLVEFADPKDVSNDERVFTACPRNYPAFDRLGKFDAHGHLNFPSNVSDPLSDPRKPSDL